MGRNKAWRRIMAQKARDKFFKRMKRPTKPNRRVESPETKG